MKRLWSRLTGPQRTSLMMLIGVITLVGIFLALFEQVEETHEIGLSGEARINHFLAVERLLIEMGVEADSVWGLEEMPEDGVLLLLDNDPDFRARIADDVLAWVEDGGVALVGATILGPNPILEGAGFVVPEWLLDTGVEEDLAEADPDDEDLTDAAEIETRAYGAGLLTMLPEPTRYINLTIGHSDIDALWVALSRSGHPTRATLVIRGTSPSILGAIWRAGRPAVVSLLVLVFAACWRASRRLGPLLPDPDTDRRSLLEHIEATGVFLWRQGHAGVLLESARKVAGQPPEGEAITDPRQFTAEIQRLQQEWKLAEQHRDH